MAKRILLVNKFYYNRGGDCIVMMNTEKLLRDNGYDVGVYAMHYSENDQSPWSRYFASEVNFGGDMSAKIKGLKRTLGMGDIKASFAKILKDFNPDVVHLHNIHSYLSPALAEIAHKQGKKVVWTMHDYKLLCPAYSCLRNEQTCELCFHDKSPVIKHRCMKGSLAGSAIAWLEAQKWNKKRLQQSTHTFICPSQFMAQKMTEGGFEPSQLEVLCNFVDPNKLALYKTLDTHTRQDYYCYVGRLSPEKGVETMLKAAAHSQHKFQVAGDGPLASKLQAQYAHCNNIKFLGRLNAQEVSHLLANARFSVIASECYENNPLGVIESLCAGTPVVGANKGGIPELINSHNGIIFTAGNSQMLARCIEQAWNKPWNYNSIKQEAFKAFSPETHLNKLECIYQSQAMLHPPASQ